MSRATIEASASGFTPRKPSLNEVGPSCIVHPWLIRVSSACCITGIPSSRAVSNASRIIASPRMGRPSSVTATAPASTNALKFVSRSPALPIVAAAIGRTLTIARRSGFCIQRVISSESLTGAVFGMGHTVVKPPAAAAAVPLAMVSLWLWPGSRRCTCRSINPGETSNPRASRTVCPCSGIFPL